MAKMSLAELSALRPQNDPVPPMFLGFSGGMTPLQQRTNIAAFGTNADDSRYRTPQASQFYRDMAFRSLLTPEGGLSAGDIADIERQYLMYLGQVPEDDSPEAFLSALARAVPFTNVPTLKPVLPAPTPVGPTLTTPGLGSGAVHDGSGESGQAPGADGQSSGVASAGDVGGQMGNAATTAAVASGLAGLAGVGLGVPGIGLATNVGLAALGHPQDPVSNAIAMGLAPTTTSVNQGLAESVAPGLANDTAEAVVEGTSPGAGIGGGNQGADTGAASSGVAGVGPGSSSDGTPGAADNAGGGVGDAGGSSGGDNAGSADGSAYATGGKVTRDRLRGPNPPGPDDGEADLDLDEFIVTKKAAKKYIGLLKAMNKGASKAVLKRELDKAA